MKNWPEDDKPADFEDLVKPIKKALRFAYKMRRQNQDKDVPWAGPAKTGHEACCLPPKETLKAEQLKYSLEDQGRDALDEIIGIALRVGIEQGRRIVEGDSHVKLMARLGELYLDKERSKA